MSDQVLDQIDDFFGQFSFQTLEETLWISERKQISNTYGEGYYLSGSKIKDCWKQETLWIIGEENGLIDPGSPSLMAIVCDEHNISNFKFSVIKNSGHQDCLMGKDCESTFNLISAHLQSDPDSQ